MTNLTEKQRAALEALRDVMREHEIGFMATVHDYHYETRPILYIGENGIDTKAEVLESKDITDLLEQEKECQEE